MEPPRNPCIAAAADDRRHCILGSLFGVRCCAAGDCALCVAAERRLTEQGFDARRVSELLVATWYSTVERCPLCGLPGPPTPEALPPLPRWVRRLGEHYTSAACLVCGEPLALRQRAICSWQCWMEYRAQVEGFDFQGFLPMPRAYRVGEI